MSDLSDRLAAALVDRYLIERELGRGGMAVVYLAEDRRHQRKVALKVLRPELAASLGAERFLREIQLAAQLNHPHILPLHDSGQTDGVLWYTMPYVEGESLRDRLTREGQLPIDEAVRITQEVADGLGYAHTQGIIHRDIKPENILLSRGHAVIADFGIATAVTEAGGERLTETGIAVGTPAYMSPEQGAGSGTLDARSDLYSLGCVLYEMLSGETPYTGPTPQAILAKKLTEPLPRITTVRETVPGPVEAALTKALAKAPADRYVTAAQFTQALSADVQVYEHRQRRRVFLRRVAIAAVAIVVIGGAAYGVVRYRAATSWQRQPVDPNTVAVLPFRVTGASPDLQVLREGLPLLLYSELTGDIGPRSVDFGTLMRRLEEWEARGEWRAEEAPLKLATTFEAGMLIEGAIAQMGAQFMVNAILRRVPGGEEVARASEPATMETLNAMPARILVQLLGGLLGENAERLDRLSEQDLEAVKAYMLGLEAQRVGKLPEAIVHFEDAATRDSAFALPLLRIGLMIDQAQKPGESVEEVWARWERSLRRAKELRASLSRRDDAALTFHLINAGIDTMENGAALLDASRTWASLAPDDPEAVQWYANQLWMSGAITDEPDWLRKFREARERVWNLDRETPRRVIDLAYWGALYPGDRDWAERMAPVVEGRVDSTAAQWAGTRWALAQLIGDTATVRDMRARAERGDERVVQWASLPMMTPANQGFVPMHDALLLGEHVALDPRALAWLTWLPAGRIAQAAAVLPVYDRVDLAVVFPGLDSAAAVAADTLEAWLARNPTEPIGHWQGGFVRYRQGEHRCYALLARALAGDTVGVRVQAEQLVPEYVSAHRLPVCPRKVQALVEGHDGARTDTPALDRFETLMRTGPGSEVVAATGMIIVSRLARQRGQLDRALKALDDACCWGWAVGLVTQAPRLKELGELALMQGDTARAIEAWTRYLNIRVDPDPGVVQAEVDSVRLALEELGRAR